MSLIVGTGVGKSFGVDYVIQGARFQVSEGERIGLVGPNGQGKTTLLRLLCRQDSPTVGEIQFRTDLRVGYLPQDAPALVGRTLWESMQEDFAHVHAMEAEMNSLAGQLGQDADGQKLAAYGELHTKFETLGGYDIDNRVRTVLSGLNFGPSQYDMPLAHLSGGQRTRALLAKLLLQEPEVLLLDEPTNHLDLEAVEWLERHLQGFGKTLIVVSHDRYFLDRVTNRTWEISFSNLDVYRGSYSQYVRQRDERFVERMRQWQAQQEFIERTEEFIRRHLAGQRTKEAQGRRTRLERFKAAEAIARPRRHQHVDVRINPLNRTGDLVVRTSGLVIGYDKLRPLADIGSQEVRRGQRVALVGPNGIGKTTLLGTLMGNLPALEGSCELGANVQPGYLPQTHDNLRPDATVLESLQSVDADLKAERARTLLGSFLFTGDDVFKKISELSGGQRSRVILAQLVATGPNLLLLDEPTNHLDLPSRELVQEMLKEFAGTVIFTSHDRYLIEALATHIWALDGGTIHPLDGGWENYVRWRTEFRSGASAAAPPEKKQQHDRRQANIAARKADRDRQRLRRKCEAVEQAIMELERKLRELMDASGQAGEAGDLDRVGDLGRQYTAADEQLQELWRQYAQLHDQLDACP
jgi:ATP-binding cassette subfamily F protein 3